MALEGISTKSKFDCMNKNFLKAGVVITAAFLIYFVYQLFKPSRTLHDVLEKYGYAELNPASQLAAPGTIVVIDKNKDGVMNVICPCVNAFGETVATKYRESPTVDISITQELQESLSLDLQGYKAGGAIGFKAVKMIELKLTNVKLLELPDDAVIELLNNRSTACKNVIDVRKKQGKPISMIKKVIQADAEYKISFQTTVNENVKSEILDSIKLELGGSSVDSETNRVVGKALYWGFDDDEQLGNMQPGELSATGSKGNKRLSNPKDSYKTQIDVVSYEVQPIKQEKDNDCWLAVYSMMKSWQVGKPLTKNEVAEELGDPWLAYYKNNTGLPESSTSLFQLTTGLKSEPPANYIPLAYKEFLENYGPVWITTGDGLSSHARLLIGIYGNTLNDLSTFAFIDPKTGNVQEQDFQTFFNEFEAEAKFINAKRPDLDFRIQIMHF